MEIVLVSSLEQNHDFVQEFDQFVRLISISREFGENFIVEEILGEREVAICTTVICTTNWLFVQLLFAIPIGNCYLHYLGKRRYVSSDFPSAPPGASRSPLGGI